MAEASGEANEDHASSSSSSESEIEDDNELAELREQSHVLQAQLDRNPYQYEVHVQLIQLLRQQGDLELVRSARETMSNVYPLASDLWLSWLQDEMPLASLPEACVQLRALFDRAVEDYLSVDVWMLYCQFAVDRMELFDDGIEFPRGVFEQAVTACGQHVTKGGIIWDAYREFEMAVLTSLQELQEEGQIEVVLQEQIGKQHDKVNTLYRRQLGVPLTGLKEVFEEYKQWSDEVVAAASIPQFSTALNMLERLTPLEEVMTRSSPPNVKEYQLYIAAVKKDKLLSNPTRITNLYQRAVAENCLHDNLWLQYTNYVVSLKIDHVILGVFKQAVRNFPWSCDLWVGYCRALERGHSSHEEVLNTLERSLGGGITEATDCLRLWTTYCDYMIRRVSQPAATTSPSPLPSCSTASPLDELRSTFLRAREYMESHFKSSGDPKSTLLRNQARLEASCYDNIAAARLLWQDVMKLHGRHANYWMEYANLERVYGDVTECRKVLQLAINSVTEDVSVLCDGLLELEQDKGTLETYEAAVARIAAQKKRLKERKDKEGENPKQGKKPQKSHDQPEGRKQGPQKQDRPMSQQEPRQPENRRKRPINTHVFFEEAPADEGTFKKPKKFHTSSVPTAGMSVETIQSKAVPVGGVAEQLQQQSAEPKGDDVAEEGGVARTGGRGSGDTECTVFVSNLPFAVTEEDLRGKFKHCGDITDVRLAHKHISGKACKFGYVEFQSKECAKMALRLDRSELCGRAIFVSPCKKGTEGGSLEQQIQRDDKATVFISNLPFFVTKETVGEIFSECGPVKQVRLVMRNNNKCKGIGYVQYCNEADAHKAVDKFHGHSINNRTISVAISNPPGKNRGTEGKSSLDFAMETSEQQTPDYSYRKSCSAISLVPRAIARKPYNSPPADGDRSTAQPLSNDDFRKLLGK